MVAVGRWSPRRRGAVLVALVVALGTVTPAAAITAAAAPLTPQAAPAVVPQQQGATCSGAPRVRCVWTYGGNVVVPAGVRQVHIEARGGAGGDGRFGGDGGGGSVLVADVPVSRGQRLDVVVGEQGRRGLTRSTYVPGGNGAGRGGRGGSNPAPNPVTYAGGGGGGASRVSVGTQALVVAGGGGGGGGKGSLTSRGGDGEPSGPTTDGPNGADGLPSARGDSGSGGGGGGVRGGQAGRPGDDGTFYSSGSHGGHAGTSTSPPGTYFREGENRGEGRVVITFDEPTDQRSRAELGVAVDAPARVVAGAPFPVTVTVTNRGGLPFDDVSTRVSFGPSLQVLGADPGPEVTWDADALAAGQTLTRQYTVVSPKVGRRTVIAVGAGRGATGSDVDQDHARIVSDPGPRS